MTYKAIAEAHKISITRVRQILEVWGMYDLHIGDTITCRDAKDAGNVGDELCKEGYLWDFRYEYDKEGNKKILIVIEGYQSDLEETKWG